PWRQLGDLDERVQALSVRGRAVSDHRWLPRIARTAYALGRPDRCRDGAGNPLLRIRTDRPDVTSDRAAKVSVQHSVAVAFIYGAAGLPQYADQCIREPAVFELRRKVTVEED